MSTVHPDAGIVWFAGMGFRPAVWTPPHRHDEVDPPRLVPSPDADVPLDGKVPAHLLGYTWATVLPEADAPASTAPQITAASLAGPAPVPAVWHPSTPSQPWGPSEPNGPDYPCNCITPDFPPVAPVPVMADAAVMLMTALAAFWLWGRK